METFWAGFAVGFMFASVLATFVSSSYRSQLEARVRQQCELEFENRRLQEQADCLSKPEQKHSTRTMFGD